MVAGPYRVVVARQEGPPNRRLGTSTHRQEGVAYLGVRTRKRMHL